MGRDVVPVPGLQMLVFKNQHLSKEKPELIIKELGSIAVSLGDKWGGLGVMLGFLDLILLHFWIFDLP